jgi:ribA/ribD-fused uncharacterized protein
MDKQILFYSDNDMLSNFYKCNIIHNDRSFPTSEHLYQACKFIYEGMTNIEVEYVEIIRQASTPYKAKILANLKENNRYPSFQPLNEAIKKYKSLGIKMNPNFHNIKISLMRGILDLKFKQNIHLYNYLINTDNFELIENSPSDYFWGIGKDKTGENHLGKCLMELRSYYKNKK